MEISSTKTGKKWLLGVDDSSLPVEIGYFEKADDKLHFHENIFEYYLIISGTMGLAVDDKNIELREGDVCCVEPAEKHRVTHTSQDLKCYLVKYPHLPDDKIIL